ncbi:hypothetical protein D1646_13505 [Pseudoflavonifractor sp. 60]|nr:hypothetical protein [Pseudoflavonifractor sp. 60]
MDIRSDRQKGRTEVPHGSPDGKVVCGVAAEAGVHVKRTQALEDRPKQIADKRQEEAPYSALQISEKLRSFWRFLA